ncbi:hypothetical protein COCSUDRAFT_67560 [Coccomyxa subellipsoidea C-169]|uniref:Uncharacterized protein n=1 Tax=Coccomyxa subellipsoidea (strain C-169) TaxID=574566 RepID=I0YPF5_COCSC|nr:hypothetical protein COCSUDRAFT_67560 [Coccomyxa subellipsoidea C-169]EIE20274.1 hypothetical protein COCSUDRAFT_67560 [Coccomyxa subellipsoidea C-169]|eukprot:XP_005644818.1 hypothetical protein COCSUDRAFT_67560 [Coccomyxa subellipsoidea C-169]
MPVYTALQFEERSMDRARSLSPRRKSRLPHYQDDPARTKRGKSAARLPRASLILLIPLVYLGLWALRWSWQETAVEVCGARLDPLQLWAGAHQMNVVRRGLYDVLEAQLGHTGLMLGREQTQGLDARSLFRKRDGRVEPALQPLQVPVRAVVLHLGDPAAARALSAAVARHMSPLAQDAGLWLQDPAKYHATLFHASTHEFPVEASSAEVETEVKAVERSAVHLCPIEVVLERVIATPTGNILACWQILGGSDPAAVRRHGSPCLPSCQWALRGALPRAPPAEQQTVHDPAILHTTLARLLRLPRASAGRVLRSGAPDGAELLRSAVARISADLCGLRATLPTLWYVEEEDLLALALNGRVRKHPVQMLCQRPPPLVANVESIQKVAANQFPFS